MLSPPSPQFMRLISPEPIQKLKKTDTPDSAGTTAEKTFADFEMGSIDPARRSLNASMRS
jgi:hypothetical protein